MVFYNCFCVPPATGGTQVTESTVVTTSTAHSIYAQWAAKQYIVTLDANGGNVTPSTITVTYNSTYESLPIPSRTNYDFDGWYTNRSGGNSISNNMTVITSTNHTLYAQWTLKYKECKCCGKNYYTCSCSLTFCDICGKCINCCEGHSSSGGDSDCQRCHGTRKIDCNGSWVATGKTERHSNFYHPNTDSCVVTIVEYECDCCGTRVYPHSCECGYYNHDEDPRVMHTMDCPDCM